MMTRVLVTILCCLQTTLPAWDRPLILVTPKGVWQSTPVDGIPGPWVPVDADVIIQGFNGDAPDPPLPPPPSDSDVDQVTDLAKQYLKTAQEATAVSALVTAVADASTPAQFPAALKRGAITVDDFLDSDGRLRQFVDAALLVTEDPAKLTAGVNAAFSLAEMDGFNRAVEAGDASLIPESMSANPREALDFVAILELITMVIELLQKLGLL